MQQSDFSIEKEFFDRDYGIIIGIDEAGRGPLAGPVVAAASMIRNFELMDPDSAIYSGEKASEFPKKMDLIRDSKTLSQKQREKVFDFIQELFYIGIGMCHHETIDRINILEASFLAMKKAIVDLKRNMSREGGMGAHKTAQEMKSVILLDGNQKIRNLSWEQIAIVNGDKAVKSISAASIAAKVIRDRIMINMHEKYPQYGFNRHKGYGTKEHMEKISVYGACEIHRKSFEPIKSWIKTNKK